MVNNLLYIFIALLALVWLWVIYNKYKPAKKGNQQPEQKSQEDNSLVVEVLKEDHYTETAVEADQDFSPLPPEKTHKELVLEQNIRNKEVWKLLIKQDTNMFFEDLFKRTEEQNPCGNFFDTTCGGQVMKISKGLKYANTQIIFDYLYHLGWDNYFYSSRHSNWGSYLSLLLGRLPESEQAEVLLKWEDDIHTNQEVSVKMFLKFVSLKLIGKYGGPTELQSHYENRYSLLIGEEDRWDWWER